jgi:Cu(I)/Ag(I) efflux system membrane fusion protein
MSEQSGPGHSWRWPGLVVAVLAAFCLGYLFRGGGRHVAAPQGPAQKKTETVWTCSMHPQIRLPNPGKCPICEMPLVPAEAAGSDGGTPVLKLSDHARAMASVETAPVTRRRLTKELRSVGRIQYNETALATVASRVDGYVERLFADYAGMPIEKGDHLIDLYSPDLVVAQQELLLALQNPANTGLIEAVKIKLRRWEISDAQIEEIARTKKFQERMTIYSPVKGTVVEKLVVEKSPVKAGDVLYRLADLKSLWVYLDIYEYEIAWVQYGQQVDLVAESFPGHSFKGMVTFLSPTLDEATRTIRVRAIVDNTDGRLKPGMFASAIIRVPLRSDGKPAPSGVEGKYSCPMHPEVLQDKAGACTICGMPLKLIPPAAPPTAGAAGGDKYTCPMHPKVVSDKPGNCPDCEMKLEKVAAKETFTCPMHPKVVSDKPGNCPDCEMKLEKQAPPSDEILAVPVTAVLDSGLRKLVFVERQKGEFTPREVTLGSRAGDYYPVLSGLNEHDAVAVRGNFLLDSQFQIRGQMSLLNPAGGEPTDKPAAPAHPPGHQH